MEEALRERYGHEVALEELTRFVNGFPDLGLSEADASVFVNYIEKYREDHRAVISEDIASVVEGIEVEGLLEIWERWIGLDSVLLHVLIPGFLAKMKSPSVDLALWVLKQGLYYPYYPNPSFNRVFVQAAIRRLGLCDVLETISSEAVQTDKESLERIGSASLWAYYDPNDLSGPRPVDHDIQRERLLRRRLLRWFSLTSVSFRLWQALRREHGGRWSLLAWI